MFILAEKPSVAKDFKNALQGMPNLIISYCIGHLFQLEEPKHYGSEIPIIPERFDYTINPKTVEQTKLVIKLLKENANSDILIATDADREGEIIARECLFMAGIKDFSKIKRFWVSQALTPDVIKTGIQNAQPLTNYNELASQGFARQRADWLVGMNFSRYVSSAANRKLSVGRVQTAILSAIETRCDLIKNFVPEKYYEHYGYFEPTRVGSNTKIKGIVFNLSGTKFKDSSLELSLKTCIGTQAKLQDFQTENKETLPPQLYNLNELQKDAFKYFEFDAAKTLKILQSLYEELKCVSYPRTPSRVMGSKNTELCQNIFNQFCTENSELNQLKELEDFSLSNKRCFNDAKLEAHHALIPLKKISVQASDEQKKIYQLIYERFLTAFLPAQKYKKTTVILNVDNNTFKIIGKNITEYGWNNKNFSKILPLMFDRHVSVQKEDSEEETQEFSNIDWNNLVLTDIQTVEKWTKPPKYYNEASILSFMENPKYDRHVSVADDSDESEPTRVGSKLVGLGTPATRHTFIPKLIKLGYIEVVKNNFICTQLGKEFLCAVRNSSIAKTADISQTTDWEEELQNNPVAFISDIKNFVRTSVSQKFNIELSAIKTDDTLCPICKNPIRESAKNFFCSGYKEGCNFPSIWKNSSGTSFTKSDVKNLCTGKKTGIKKCTSKEGKTYECRFILDSNYRLARIFENK